MPPTLALEDERHRLGEATPLIDFFAKRFASRLGQRVVARAPVVLGRLPITLDPAAVLEALERGVEGSLIDLESAARDLLDAETDAPPVHRLERKRLEDEEIDAAP